ncbi:unnamed protein product [Callosobruchus maculatus]|uniref:NADP-dependent oxidoreductase domain-containing protein n=1 Tax=Callosobruchus maculatus TaxID=64391 RepID=A0A653CCA5_CALMS|nr:unnamed protein product [Callosobruchus maculatus]
MSVEMEVELNNGYKMPVIGLGTWMATDEDSLTAAVHEALKLGYRHIDTASAYDNEHVIGKVLKEWFDEGKLTQKVEKFLRRSLEALQLDYVDMYLIHVPFTVVEHVGPNGQPFAGFKEDGTVYMDESTDLVAIWKIQRVVTITNMSSGKCSRNGDEIFVTTKLPGYGNVPEKVEKFLRRSLEALQLDYVDMYLIHVPFTLVEHVGPNGQPCVGFKEDGTVDMDESTDLVAIWKEFEKFQRQGLTRSIGVSDFNMNQIERILKNCEIRPSNHQFEYHAALQVDDMVSFCKDNDIVCTGYATLGSGAASSFAEVPGLLNNSTVVEIAEKHKKTAAQVLRHSVQKGLVVIPKSTNPERVKENFEIFDFELDDEDMDALAGLDCNFRIYDFEQYFFKGIKNHPEYPY